MGYDDIEIQSQVINNAKGTNESKALCLTKHKSVKNKNNKCMFYNLKVIKIAQGSIQ